MPGIFQREISRKPRRIQEISDLKIFICLRLCFQKQLAPTLKLLNNFFWIFKIAKKLLLQKYRMEFPLDTEMISYSTESDHDVDYKPSPMLVDPIYISSDEDEEMSSFLSGTISEEDNMADDEGSLESEIRSMSVHVETAMFAPIPIRPTFAQTVVTPPSTPRRRLFSREDFNFDMGRGWISEERKNHPIGLCRTIVPVADTPQSPDTPNKRPDIYRPYDLPGPSERRMEPSSQGPNVSTITGHMEKVRLGQEESNQFSDCIICGKSYKEIVETAVQEYLRRTWIEGESRESVDSRRVAFLAGLQAGTFMFVPRGLSQAAACDGNLYTMDTGVSVQKALPGTLPLC